MNKSEINKKANSLFNSIKDVDELIATEDGQFFTVKNKNAAENHCRFINGKTRETPLKHFVIKRNENRGKIVFDEDEYSEEKINQIIEDDDY
ncbi:MAG: hypothetical protein JXA16_01015 [Bacteroidales bacterium]|nr:hypothetical protein [Bacteroidales bacterium]